MVLVEADEGLLLAVRADQGVDLDRLHVVQLLHRVLDLRLVAADVDDEDEGVGVLNLLHRALSGEGETNDGEEVVLLHNRGGAVGALRCRLGAQGVGTVELHNETLLPLLQGRRLCGLLHVLLHLLGVVSLHLVGDNLAGVLGGGHYDKRFFCEVGLCKEDGV